MSEEPHDLQTVFRSALPVGTSLIVIFVPNQDRDGQPIDQENWVDEVLTTLAVCSAAPPRILAVEAYGVTMPVAASC